MCETPGVTPRAPPFLVFSTAGTWTAAAAARVVDGQGGAQRAGAPANVLQAKGLQQELREVTTAQYRDLETSPPSILVAARIA